MSDRYSGVIDTRTLLEIRRRLNQKREVVVWEMDTPELLETCFLEGVSLTDLLKEVG